MKIIKSKKTLLWLLLMIFALSAIMSLQIGWVETSLSTIVKVLLMGTGLFSFDVPETTKSIILNVRLPRIILDILVGLSLAISGCAMQGLFRNPMASPYVTGVASASAFGAALVIVTGINIFWVGMGAFAMALLTVFFVYNLAKTKYGLPSGTLLLAGIAVSLFFSALVSFIQYIANERELRQIVLWLMGRLWEANWHGVVRAMPFILVGSMALLFFHKELDIILLGDRAALNLGVEVEKVRRWVLVITALITGAAVAVSGVIGFIGLIVPHIMRMLIGPEHKYLLPASAISGGIFLIWTDTIARTIIAPVELPVGIITAIIGVPFFLFILKRRRKMLGFFYDS